MAQPVPGLAKGRSAFGARPSKGGANLGHHFGNLEQAQRAGDTQILMELRHKNGRHQNSGQMLYLQRFFQRFFLLISIYECYTYLHSATNTAGA